MPGKAIQAVGGRDRVSVLVIPGDVAFAKSWGGPRPASGLLPAPGMPTPAALAETLKHPIAHALGGREHVDWDHPYDVGMTGLIGFSSGYYAMMDADVLPMLGTGLPLPAVLPREGQDRSGGQVPAPGPKTRET